MSAVQKLAALTAALDAQIEAWRYTGKSANATDADWLYDECADRLAEVMREALGDF